MTILLFRRRFERHFRLSGIFFCVVWEESNPLWGCIKFNLYLNFVQFIMQKLFRFKSVFFEGQPGAGSGSCRGDATEVAVGQDKASLTYSSGFFTSMDALG